MFFALILIFILSILAILLSKRTKKGLVIISVICAVLIVFHIVCVFLYGQEKIDDNVLEIISRISWGDEEQLYNLGFEKEEETLFYDSGVTRGENAGETSFFCIYVEKEDQIEAEKEYKMKSRNGILYAHQVVYGYGNMFTEFINHPQTASRYYYFYADGYLISVREHNEQDVNRLFEQFIVSLSIQNDL